MAQDTSLHDLAVSAEANLEQLATGLAKAGADSSTVDAVTKMATVTRKIVSVLGKGQEQTADNAPPEPQPQTPAPAPAPSAGPPPGGHTMDSATADLHNQMQANAAATKQHGAQH